MHTCTFIFNQTAQNTFTSPSGCGSTRSRFSWHPWRRMHLPWLTGTPNDPKDGNPTCYQVTGMMKYSWKANLFPAKGPCGLKTAIQVIQPYSKTCDGKLEIYLCFRLNGQFVYIYIHNMNICEVVMLMPPAVANAITSKSCLNSHLHVSIPHSHGRSWKHQWSHWTEHGMADTHTHRAGLLLLISNAIKCNKYESTSKIPHMKLSNLSKKM